MDEQLSGPGVSAGRADCRVVYLDLTNAAWKNYLPSPQEPEYEDKEEGQKPGTKK